MKDCLKCGNNIKKYQYKGIEFDLCKDCGTVIISKQNFENLAKHVDMKCKIIDLFELVPISVKKDVRKCPYCDEEMEQVYCEGVLIDRCKKCNLLLFDDGELAKYFTIFSSEPIEVMSNAAFIKKYCDSEIVERIDNIGGKMQIKSRIKEKEVFYINGWSMLFIDIILFCIVALLIMFQILFGNILGPLLMIPAVPCFLTAVFLSGGFKVLKPQEAIVFMLFGEYYGTLKTPGFYWVNPLAMPHADHISLKVRTLETPKQKINDLHGNPIEVGIMVTWEVKDTAKALFSVNHYNSFLSSQCDSALRNIVRLYPYDVPDDSGKKSLKDDNVEISEKLKQRIQENVIEAGIYIIDARITNLSYSQEIAMAMLQRQQANAIIDAKRAIVDGAVSMVEMAIEKLSQNKNIVLDDKTKASMVNNLLVILCGNKESQPVINNGMM